MSQFVDLARNTNQALGIARYAIDFIGGPHGPGAGKPSESVLRKTDHFWTDSVICGLSALSLGTNAPTLLREEALSYPVTNAAWKPSRATSAGATVFGSDVLVHPEKAIVANSAAVREWDSNGTNFGYDPSRGNTAGEFGHNDFYPVCLAAAQMVGMDGASALRAMVCHDEIRGRLAEVFSLKSYKIDHVVHGAIASAAVFGAMLGATPEQIESAIGMAVAHYIPWRAIRAGKQLSDSKGSSAAISTEAAVLSVKRSMQGFMGPRDIFRNPEAIFRAFEGPGQLFARIGYHEKANTKAADASPFDLALAMSGDDFAVMGMHFKIGLYEHQSAGALQALLDLLNKAPGLLDDAAGERIKAIRIKAYEPAFGIIGDPAKRNPTTRQSADHSMLYIVATLLRKALEGRSAGLATTWEDLLLVPHDYSGAAIQNTITRRLMDKIQFEHGGDEYDRRYPDGIPTSLTIEAVDGTTYDSGMIMYPAGHARNTTYTLEKLLDAKWNKLARLVDQNPAPIIERYRNLGGKTAQQIASINAFTLHQHEQFE